MSPQRARPGWLPLLLIPGSTAAQVPPAPTVGLAALPYGLPGVVGALVLVIALLVATLWLLRRLAVPTQGPYPLRVLGRLAVGPREHLITVAVGEEVLLLGVGGGGGIRKLHTLPALPAPPPAPPAVGFREQLSAWQHARRVSPPQATRRGDPARATPAAARHAR